jgi:hypothetical protein
MSQGHGHGHGPETSNKTIAIFISFIALLLALSETLAKGAQTNQISYNVEASNLWAFYQAKTIRQTTLKTASEQMEVDIGLARDPGTKARLEKRVADWKAEVDRYQSEPKIDPKTGASKGEGRRELMARAIEAEKKRDLYADKYHLYEIASAVFQIALVITSVYLLTNASLLLWGSAGLCLTGAVLTAVGLFAPQLLAPYLH